MKKMKRVQVTGPFGTYTGLIVIEIDEVGKTQSYTYRNHSSHDEEERKKRVYRHVIKSYIDEGYYLSGKDCFGYTSVSQKEEIIPTATKVEEELRERLKFLTQHDQTDQFQKALKENGYE